MTGEGTKLIIQRLSEKFWRTFTKLLHEEVSKTTTSEELLPEIGTFETELTRSRLPKPIAVNGTLAGIDLFIGSPDINPEEAISIPVKYSKATMRARPPTLSKAWKPAMDLQTPLLPKARVGDASSSSQLLSSFGQGRTGDGQADLAAMISSDVKAYSTYVVKKPDPAALAAEASQAQSSQRMPSQAAAAQRRGSPDEVEAAEEEAEEKPEPEEEEEESVAKEDIVKAWRFGSTWVPMEADTFEPVNTKKGIEVLGFFPRANVS